jgi:methionyl-tRNA formyltransferase
MIRNRESIGAVTVHQMDEHLDTGDILLTKEVPIYPEASFGMLIGQLAYVGLELTTTLLQGLVLRDRFCFHSFFFLRKLFLFQTLVC